MGSAQDVPHLCAKEEPRGQDVSSLPWLTCQRLSGARGHPPEWSGAASPVDLPAGHRQATACQTCCQFSCHGTREPRARPGFPIPPQPSCSPDGGHLLGPSGCVPPSGGRKFELTAVLSSPPHRGEGLRKAGETEGWTQTDRQKLSRAWPLPGVTVAPCVPWAPSAPAMRSLGRRKPCHRGDPGTSSPPSPRVGFPPTPF